MSKETYEISGDGTGEEIEVQRVICTKCGHYEFMTPAEASKIDDSFQCPLCYTPPGVHNVVKTYEQCGVCGEVMRPDKKCFCPEKIKPTLQYYHKSDELKNPVTKRLEEEIEEGKLQTMEKKIVRNAKREAEERQIRMDENLQKLVELQLKKERKDAV